MSSSHDSDEVANPHRTQVDEDPSSLGQPNATEEHTEDDEEERRGRDKRDQPWPEVADEVKQAVEEAGGPLS